MRSRIAEERGKLYWSQETLAQFLEVPTAHIEEWERDPAHIPARYALKMSQCFGCSVDYLFGLSDERCEPPKKS